MKLKLLLLTALIIVTMGALGCNTSTTATLKIVNNSSYIINDVYVSKSSSSYWGADQLGYNIITVGETFTLTEIPPDTYDIKVSSSTGQKEERHDVALTSPIIYTETFSNLANIVQGEDTSNIEKSDSQKITIDTTGDEKIVEYHITDEPGEPK
jgi:hypothetical protein